MGNLRDRALLWSEKVWSGGNGFASRVLEDFAESVLEPEQKAHDRTVEALRDLRTWDHPVCTCPRVAGGPCPRCRIDAALAAHAAMR